MKRKAIAPPSADLPTVDTNDGPRRIGLKELRHNPDHTHSLFRKSRLAARRPDGGTPQESGAAKVPAPAAPTDVDEYLQRRDSFRLAVSLKTIVYWTPEGRSGEVERCMGVVTSLSGGGALLFLRRLPEADNMTISFNAPFDFIEERARRATGIAKTGERTRGGRHGHFIRSCEKVRANMRGVEAKLLKIVEYSRDSRGPVYALSLAFEEPREELYRLVRYFERQGLNREANLPPRRRAPAARTPVSATA